MLLHPSLLPHSVSSVPAALPSFVFGESYRNFPSQQSIKPSQCLAASARRAEKKQEKRNKWNQAAGLVTGAHNWGSQFLVQQNSQLFPHPRALGTFPLLSAEPLPSLVLQQNKHKYCWRAPGTQGRDREQILHLFLFPILFFPFCSLFQRNLCSRVTHTLPRHFCCQSWLTGHPRKELLPFPPKQPLLGMLLLSKVFFFWNKKISHVCKPLSWEGKRGERSSQLYLFKMNIKSRTKGHIKLNEFHNFHSFS